VRDASGGFQKKLITARGGWSFPATRSGPRRSPVSRLLNKVAMRVEKDQRLFAADHRGFVADCSVWREGCDPQRALMNLFCHPRDVPASRNVPRSKKKSLGSLRVGNVNAREAVRVEAALVRGPSSCSARPKSRDEPFSAACQPVSPRRKRWSSELWRDGTSPGPEFLCDLYHLLRPPRSQSRFPGIP
jgi:hypothetical protein